MVRPSSASGRGVGEDAGSHSTESPEGLFECIPCLRKQFGLSGYERNDRHLSCRI